MSNPSLHLPSQHLRTHVNILSALLEPSGSCSHFERLRGASSLDQAFRALQRSQKCWQVHCLRAARPSNFERLGGDERPASSGAEGASSRAEGARAAISNAPSEPKWLDVANVGRCGVFAAGPSQLIELLSAWNVEAINIYSVEFSNAYARSLCSCFSCSFAQVLHCASELGFTVQILLRLMAPKEKRMPSKVKKKVKNQFAIVVGNHTFCPNDPEKEKRLDQLYDTMTEVPNGPAKEEGEAVVDEVLDEGLRQFEQWRDHDGNPQKDNFRLGQQDGNPQKDKFRLGQDQILEGMRKLKQWHDENGNPQKDKFSFGQEQILEGMRELERCNDTTRWERWVAKRAGSNDGIGLALGGMQINVQTPTGQTFKLCMSHSASPKSIKALLRAMRHPVEGYKLLVELQEGHPVRLPIVHNATLFLVKTAYRISVIHGTKWKWKERFDLDVEASYTIYKVKEMIQAATVCDDNEWGCPKEVQQLSSRGKPLETDMNTLSDYAVGVDATIVCTWDEFVMQERLRLYEKFGPPETCD